MAGILRKLQNSELISYDEGVSEELDVFPVTHSKGVFHQLDENYITEDINDLNQLSLEEIVNRTGFLNSNAWTDGRTVMSLQVAISAVPPEFRKPGFVITYQDPSTSSEDREMMNGWKMLQFVGTSAIDWTTPSLWKPLKAKCDCEETSGGSDVFIGNLNPGESLPLVPPTVLGREGSIYMGIEGSDLYTYKYINNTWEYQAVLTAPAGPQGPQGPRGLTGPAGPQGAKGDMPTIRMSVVDSPEGGQTVRLESESENTEFTVQNGREISMVSAASWTSASSDKVYADCELVYSNGNPTAVKAFACYKSIITPTMWTTTPDENGLYKVNYGGVNVADLDLNQHMVEFFYDATPDNFIKCSSSFIFMGQSDTEKAQVYCKIIPQEPVTVIFKVFNTTLDPLI